MFLVIWNNSKRGYSATTLRWLGPPAFFPSSLFLFSSFAEDDRKRDETLRISIRPSSSRPAVSQGICIPYETASAGGYLIILIYLKDIK